MRPHIGSLFIKNNTQGLTLVELVIVISVLGILTTVAIPRFTCFTKKAKATVALSAIKQIQKGCMYSEDGEVFTESNLPAYKIKSGKSNSCTGPELVSAIPDDKTIYPTFHLNKTSNKLSYAFNGKKGANPKDSLKLMCATSDLPPNESTLFDPNSGLSCREVKRSSPPEFSNGHTYLSGRGRDTALRIAPVTIAVGEESWKIAEIGAVKHPIWLESFAENVVSTINESESKYSAEIDPENPKSVKIYSPNGVVNNDIEMKIDSDARRRLSSSAEPYAVPAFGGCPQMCNPLNCCATRDNWDNDKQSYVFTNDQSEKETTTICDGK